MAHEAPIVTNISAAVQPCLNRFAGITLVQIESDHPARYTMESDGPRRLVVTLPDARTRMPDGSIRVCDGLLHEISLARQDHGLRIALALDHATGSTAYVVPGLPARLCIALQRAPLWRIMHGRAIVVDPGHGGEDHGGRGPIDLLEKDMTLAVARCLAEQLKHLDCAVTLTREDDRALSWPDRCAVADRAGAEAMVVLHTGWFPDPSIAGTRVCWLNDVGQTLALCIYETAVRKLPLPARGCGAGRPWADLAAPVVLVEFATISNPVEEGWLRSCTFHKRAAGAIVNGLKDHFAGGAYGRPPAG